MNHRRVMPLSRRTRGLALAAALAACAACERPGLIAVVGTLTADPREVEFGQAPLGFARTRDVAIRNTSKAGRDVQLSTEGPFEAATRVHVAAAGSTLLEIRFRPSALGRQSGRLRLTAEEGETFEVALSGEAVVPPQCAATSPCRSARVDPLTGNCIDEALADGADCSSPCLRSPSTCLNGACVGAAVSCEDNDACTVDVCDPVSGCGHIERQCPLSTDPCRAAACDPAHGCRLVDVADGTPCGEADCVTSHVCMAGSCSARPTPSGASCGVATPCRPAGTCQGSVCLQPAANVLMPSWTYSPTTGTIDFPGIADRSGNLYWFDTSPPSLVSADARGVVRYRQGLTRLPATNDRRSHSMLVADSLLVLSSRVEGWVEARTAADGQLRWRHTVDDLAEPLSVRTGRLGFWVIAMTEGAGGDVVVSFRTNYGGSAWANWVVAFDALTGSIKWSRAYTYLSELMADSLGTVFTYEDLWEHRLIAISPNGTERWNLLVGNSSMPGAAPPILAVGPSLLTGYPAAFREVSTGAVVRSSSNVSVMSHWGPSPLLSASQLVVPDSNSVCSTGIGAFSPAQLSPSWLWSTTQACIEDVSLTAGGSVLFSARPRGVSGPPLLREIDARGALRFECPLDAQALKGLSVLHDGRWVAFDVGRNRIASFNVPGAQLAPTGWVTTFGSPARSERQR